MIKLLIFDLDGTLADTGLDITNALNYALKPFGMREYSVEETKSMVGSGISSLLESLISNEQSNARVPGGEGKATNARELVTGRFLKFYSEHLHDNTVAYPGVKDTLAQLGAYKKTVLSNKRQEYSQEILDRLGIARYFDVIWGSNSVREKKPSPLPVLDLLKAFNAKKSEAIMIGDSGYDIKSGKAAGVKVIAVTYGFRKRDALEEADIIIDRFDDLLRVFAHINSGM